tara:strand:+ start:191605 stop:191796 length:192 start_codon:yes stop_codon:yes gene_type:complete
MQQAASSPRLNNHYAHDLSSAESGKISNSFYRATMPFFFDKAVSSKPVFKTIQRNNRVLDENP